MDVFCFPNICVYILLQCNGKELHIIQSDIIQWLCLYFQPYQFPFSIPNQNNQKTTRLSRNCRLENGCTLNLTPFQHNFFLICRQSSLCVYFYSQKETIISNCAVKLFALIHTHTHTNIYVHTKIYTQTEHKFSLLPFFGNACLLGCFLLQHSLALI